MYMGPCNGLELQSGCITSIIPRTPGTGSGSNMTLTRINGCSGTIHFNTVYHWFGIIAVYPVYQKLFTVIYDVFLSHAYCSQDRLQICHNPDQDKRVNESE